MLPGLVGKRDSSISRFNGMSHGLRSQFEVVEGESYEEYEAFKRELYDDLKPNGSLQKALVDRVIFFLWRLKRAARAEAALAIANLSYDMHEKINWERLLSGSLLDQVIRYENHAIRQVSKLLEELRKLKIDKNGTEPEKT